MRTAGSGSKIPKSLQTSYVNGTQEDMHEKIREGESSRAVNNVEVHCCPSLPLFPGLNLRRAPRLHQNNDVRLGDICDVLTVSLNLKVKWTKS